MSELKYDPRSWLPCCDLRICQANQPYHITRARARFTKTPLRQRNPSTEYILPNMSAAGTKLRFAAMHNFGRLLVRSSAAACRTVGGRNLDIYSFRPLLRLADRAGRTSTRSAQTG
jgi:hypothetical protein